MKWGSMTRQAQDSLARGKTRTINTGPVYRESRWEVVEPVVWRYIGVMEFFSPKRIPS